MFGSWAGSAFAVIFGMDRMTRVDLEHVDPNDPTLAVDGLAEFLPTPDSCDPTLDVSALAEFFPDKPSETPTSLQLSRASVLDPGLKATGLEDCFGNLEDIAWMGRGDAASGSPASGKPVAVHVVLKVPKGKDRLDLMSETQRTILGFQRFAEKFHAFAAECQHRPRLNNRPQGAQLRPDRDQLPPAPPQTIGSLRSTSPTFEPEDRVTTAGTACCREQWAQPSQLASARPSEDAAQHAAQDLPADLAADAARRLLGHGFDHALALLGAP
jgi:hypothetical protein